VGVKQSIHDILSKRGYSMKVKRRKISSEKDLQDLFDDMYQKSKDGSEPFYDLIELMTNRETIITAIHNMKIGRASCRERVY
jgi:hypothetical protein